MTPLTKDEKKAIAALKRIAKKWPETLWLFADANTLYVMRKGPQGERVTLPSANGDGAVDPAFIVDRIRGIGVDGGCF